MRSKLRLHAAAAALASCAALAVRLDDSRPVDGEPKKSDAPPARLVIVGPKLGSMEPCGCTGGQLGGLGKLKTRLDLAVQGEPRPVVLDCGELAKGSSEMETIRGEVMATIYQLLPLSAVALGPGDLAAASEDLQLRAQVLCDPTMAHGVPNAVQAAIVTNAAAPEPIARSVVVPHASGSGARVLLLSLVQGESPKLEKPAESARAEIGRRKGAFDLAVAVFHGYAEGARALARAVPDLDLVVVTQGSGSPDEQPQLYGNTLLLHPGQKGRHVVALTLSRKNGKVVSEGYAIEVVHGNLPDDAAAKERVDGYRERLREARIVDKLKGQRPIPNGAGYAGSEKCGECHAKEFDVWKESKHAKGIPSMAARKGEWDPDCVKCHAVGWLSEPPSGEKTGYQGDPAGKLAYVGCESCHGAGKRHATQPTVHKLAKDVTCQSCHDVENSPEFEREKFWKRIQHSQSAKRTGK